VCAVHFVTTEVEMLACDRDIEGVVIHFSCSLYSYHTHVVVSVCVGEHNK